MNKRITSLMLVFTLILTMLATAVPALAAPDSSTCTYSIEADKTSANPGDTINFTIYMQQTGTQTCMEGTLVIPDGLTFVTGSGKLEDGIKTTLGWDAVDWTPDPNMILNGYGSEDFTGEEKIALMKFQCTVDSDATAKNYEVKLIDLVADGGSTEDYNTKNPTCIPATVTVTVPHTHVYDKETLDYLVSPATCTSPAVYHKSCACGAEGTETFTSGSALGHNYTKKVENNTYLKTAASNCTEYNVYWYACSRCNANAKNDAAATDKYYTSTTAGNHSFTEKIADAAHYVAGTGTNCQSVKKYYYDCAYCDQIGTTTWDSTTYGPHSYATVWSSDADGHWHECSLCHDHKDEAAHTPGAAATETTPQKCTECDYIITPALGHTHHMTLIDENPATCTTDGNTAYYVCSGCGKWFADATGNVEITDHNSVVINFLGHEWATVWSSDADGHWHACSRCNAKADEAAHTPDHTGHATDEYAIKCSFCDYVIEAQLAPRTPVTNIAATITAPELGATPDYHPVYASTPEGGVEMYDIAWFKIAVANFTGTDEDEWDEMDPDEQFEEGYYYSVDMFFDTNDGYKMSESATGTVNGKPHDSTYGDVFEEIYGAYGAYLCGLFEPLTEEYIIDLPVSLAVKLTGDEKPAKETFKFEIYDLGCEDAAFEIVNDSVVVENLEFDENGVAFVGGIIKIKVTGEDQLCNLTEGFKVRMVKGSTKGWTYASEQWYIELFFENDALDVGIGVKEIVDGEISEEYANGMSFAVSYEAVSEPGPTEPSPTEPRPTEPRPTEPDPTEPGKPADPQSPQTGDNSMAALWIALLLVSGAGVAGTAIYSRKKKYSAE